MIYQYIFEYLGSNMYLIINNNEAIVIDPHKDMDAVDFLKFNNINKVWVLLTHEHTDHTSGIFIFQDNFDCEIVCQKNCAKLIGDKRLARPLLIFFTLEERDRKFGTNLLHKFKEEYVYKTYQADITFDKEILLNLMGYQVEITHIPGHSKGSCLIKINNSIIFSGDSLMIGHPIITRFPGSEHKKFVEYSLPIFESLDRKLFVYPGHGFGFELNSMYVGDKLHIEYM